METPSPLIGLLAGVSTSVLWACTSAFFTEASKRVGPTRVNAFRLVVALGLHFVTFILLSGRLWPAMSDRQLVALALSGVIGFSICDQAMLVALLEIGARRALLLMTTSPVFALFFGWAFLGESLTAISLTGIAVTLAGVVWVTLERSEPRAGKKRQGDAAGGTQAEEGVKSGRMARGVGLAVFAALCQAAGFMFSKIGIGHGVEGATPLDPQAATMTRLFFGTLGVIPIVLWNRGVSGRITGGEASSARAVRIGFGLAAAGAVTGPFIGVWCSLIAIDRVQLGVAQTLCSLAPVVILPIAAVVWRERITVRAVLGAMVAVGGCAILFLS